MKNDFSIAPARDEDWHWITEQHVATAWDSLTPNRQAAIVRETVTARVQEQIENTRKGCVRRIARSAHACNEAVRSTTSRMRECLCMPSLGCLRRESMKEPFIPDIGKEMVRLLEDRHTEPRCESKQQHECESLGPHQHRSGQRYQDQPPRQQRPRT